ncbi:MAG: asparagine synthase (glutamine-hydrolyzing) [Nitrospirae bacterium]|nr:asparagine synthase (glutamine-hydrolyzing) [Nitrospirota bacterium]
MCGICGIIDFKCNAIDEGLISVMMNTLGHRGPDGEGIFINQGSRGKGQTALGHRRLSIIDLKTGSQPMFNEDKSIVIVYNGEIYNFNELKKDLIKKGHRFKTKSDTEIILHQYEENGWECAKRFNGIFAFALWDDNKKTLFIARDRIGIKPLYYFYNDKRLIFASEIKAILKVLSERPEIDASSLFRYLILQYIPAPATLYKNIYKLLPASVLILNKRGMEIKQYWGLEEARSQKSEVRNNDLNDEDTISGKLLKTIDESVTDQLVSDVPLGAFLSGGIDSSTIVAFMSKRMKEPVRTFSVGFDTTDPYYNELDYARIASRYFKTDHHEIIVRPQDVVNLFPVIARHLDDPINDPAVLPTYIVSKLAREHVKVVLSGEGADEFFGGYLRYSLDKLAKYYQLLPKLVRNGLIKPILDDIIENKRFVQGLNALSEADWPSRYLKWVSVFDIDAIGSALGNPDRMSMAHGLEARVPYLDNRMADFALSIPSWLKINGFKRKYIFKKAVSNILPDEIVRRSKRGFALPISHWFRNELKGFVLESLTDNSLRRIGYFSPSVVDRLLKEHMAGYADNSLQIWGLLTLNYLFEENKR